MLAEWHLSPEYLLENWTDEQFEAFWQARNGRVLETARVLAPKAEQPSTLNRRVSDAELLSFMRKTQLLPHEFDKWQN